MSRSVGDGGGDVDAGDGAGRAAGNAFLRGVEQDDRAVEAFHEARGDNTDHPGRPTRAGKHQRGGVQQGGIGFDLSYGSTVNLVAGQAALVVQRLQLVGEDDCLGIGSGGEEIHDRVGITQASQGVQPGGERETDGLF